MGQLFPMSYTGDTGPELRCQRCGRREHGTAACDTMYSTQVFDSWGYWPWPKGTKFRIMDGRWFIVAPNGICG